MERLPQPLRDEDSWVGGQRQSKPGECEVWTPANTGRGTVAILMVAKANPIQMNNNGD